MKVSFFLTMQYVAYKHEIQILLYCIDKSPPPNQTVISLIIYFSFVFFVYILVLKNYGSPNCGPMLCMSVLKSSVSHCVYTFKGLRITYRDRYSYQYGIYVKMTIKRAMMILESIFDYSHYSFSFPLFPIFFICLQIQSQL